MSESPVSHSSVPYGNGNGTATPSGQYSNGQGAVSDPAVRKKLNGYVGFANLPNQVHRKSVRTGFQFTVMVVGESGLGKSTLVNTLFNTTLYPPKEYLHPSAERPKTVAIESISADIEENGVRLRLTVVDTPGFGDFVNNDDSWKPIVENIEARFDAYLEQENRVNRQKMVDNRVHACIYFIQPSGHSLKQIDIEFMRRLHTKVNLIPVIAKSDTLTDEEIIQFKQRILNDIAHHQIRIFQAPVYENEDEETIAENEEIAGKIPFAIVGSYKQVETPDGRAVRGRVYPWGVIEVDNEDHCDFVKLRQMLIRTYMEELREHTNLVLYENYRSDKLLAMGVTQDHSVFKEINPAAKVAEERTLHEAKLAKMEAEMKMVFQQKVQEKEAKLKQSEEELYARHREMKEALEKQRIELEDKKRRLESGRPLTPEKNNIRMAQSASVQAVIEAVSVLGLHTDKNSIDAAGKWLQDFQHNDDAWATCNQLLLLPDIPEGPRAFAAQTFRTKASVSLITYDFHQVDPAHRQGLRDSLVAAIQQYSAGPRVVLVQICLALSAFVLQYPEWANPVADLIASLGQDPNTVPALLEFLTIVAEEVTTNSRIPISNEDFRNRTDQLLTNNANQVLTLLAMYIQAPGVTPAVQSQVFRCVKSWVRAGELSPTELAQSPLFGFAFDALATEQLFDAAVEVICDIIHETQEVDDFLPIIEQITARLIVIKPKLAEVGDDSDKMRGYTRIFAEAGETYRTLIVAHIETFQPIVEAILECSSYPDLDVVPITFQFWYHLSMSARSRRDSVSPVIADVYQRLTGIMIDHLRFPADFDELSAQERDEFRDFRHIMGDTLKDCCYVLGSSLCLSRTYEMILKTLGAPASNQAWQDIEAPLFAMRSMGAEIPPTDEEVVPRIMELVVRLPAHPKVRYAATLVVSRYTEWVALHPTYIPGLLDYISASFDDSDKEVVAAAGQALRFLCKDCNTHLTSYFSQLHTFVQTMSPKISQSDRVEIYEGIAHVISAMPLQDAGAALKQMSLELLEKIHEAASAPSSSVKVQTDAICDGVELLLTMLEIIGPFGEELPASCEDTCSQAWIVVDTVLTHHGGDPTVSESICRLLRAAIPLFGNAALPVIPLVIKRAVLIFDQTGIASYPWILRKCIEAHGHTGKVALREDFKQAFELVSKKLSTLLQTQPITSIPDVLEDYTALAMIMLQYTPDLLLLSSAFPIAIQVLLACLSLVQPEAIDAGVDFAYTLLGHDALSQESPSPPPNFPLYANAIRNAVGPHGAQLVSVLLNGLSGSYPEDVTSPVVSVIGELAKIWPNEFPMWITTAVELLPTSNVHPTVKSTLISDVSSAKQPQGIKKAVMSFHRSNSKMRERRREAVTPQKV
ncbi:Nuclear import receptor [Rhizoctonia solani]